MNVSRQSVSDALFGILSAAYPFNMMAQRPRIFTNFTAADYPAMQLVPLHDTGSQQNFGLPKWEMHYNCIIITLGNPSPDTPSPEIVLNSILDALDTAMLGTPPGERQTLGGLVTNAWIDGDSIKDVGALDQAVGLVIPIRVLTGI